MHVDMIGSGMSRKKLLNLGTFLAIACPQYAKSIEGRYTRTHARKTVGISHRQEQSSHKKKL